MQIFLYKASKHLELQALASVSFGVGKEKQLSGFFQLGLSLHIQNTYFLQKTTKEGESGANLKIQNKKSS